MINPKELKIGNYVAYEATTHVITELHTDKVLHRWKNGGDGFYSPYSDLQSIPLTPELLEQMGFEDYGTKVNYPGETEHRFSLYNIIEGTSSVIVALVESGDYKGWEFRIDHDTVYTKELNYLHQLQNLFYSIAGYDLCLTPKPKEA